jgi:hypothetical protein
MSNLEGWKDGIPPIGCKCEFTLGMADSETVIYHGTNVKGEHIIESLGGCVTVTNSSKFSPYKTEEDKEREEAIEYLVNDLTISKGFAVMIYNKGYRVPVKQGEVVNLDSMQELIFQAYDLYSPDACARWLDREFIIRRKLKS